MQDNEQISNKAPNAFNNYQVSRIVEVTKNKKFGVEDICIKSCLSFPKLCSAFCNLEFDVDDKKVIH